MGSLPLRADAPTTMGVWRVLRRGTSSAYARRTHPTRGHVPRARGPVLHSVLQPVLLIRHSGEWRVRACIEVGQTCASGRNRQRAPFEWTERGSPCVTAPRGNSRAAWHIQKRKEVAAFVPARTRELRCVLVRRKQLQKSTGNPLASNKLTRSAPKRATARVNGGLARGELGGAQATSGEHRAKVALRVGLRRVNGAGPTKAQGDVRASPALVLSRQR